MPGDMLRVVRDRYPDLEAQTSRVIDTGQVNAILIVNESLVFRFPRTPAGIGQLRTELTVLQMARGHLPLAVPVPTYFSANTDTPGEVFAGHHMAPGESLGKHAEAIKALPVARLDAIAYGLADFMQAMHSVLIPPDARLPDHAAGRRQSVPLLRDQAREKLAAYLPDNRQSRVFAEFERFINDPRSFDFLRALKHGDLGPGNILIDPGSLILSGVIDFGSAGLDDPAADVGFVTLWGAHLFGAPFVERVLARYGADTSLRARAGFFKMAIALTVALAGLENGNTSDLEFGLSAC